MKRYLLVLMVMLCVGGVTSCGVKQPDQAKQGAAVSQSDSDGENDDSRANDDSGENGEMDAAPIPIHVMDSAKEISVTETDLTDIVLSEEEEYVQVNNNIINGDFIYPYQGGYFYYVQKSGTDGPCDVLVYDDGQGEISGQRDMQLKSNLYFSGDSFYYQEPGGYGLKRWKDGKDQTIVESQDDSLLYVSPAKDGIYYAKVDSENKITDLCRTDAEGKIVQQLYTLDVEIEQLFYYEDELWFVFQEFDDEDFVERLGKLNLSNQQVSIYHLNKNLNRSFSAGFGVISIQNGYVYYSASGLKRLNIQDNTVEQVYPKNVDCINFAEDSILFVRNRALYRVNQDNTTKILELGKNYGKAAGISGIHVEDQKIYLLIYEGGLFENVIQIDIDGKIKKKIYNGELSDELLN